MAVPELQDFGTDCLSPNLFLTASWEAITRMINFAITTNDNEYTLWKNENFYNTAVSAIADEIGEILIDPYLTAVENTFADLRDEEEK